MSNTQRAVFIRTFYSLALGRAFLIAFIVGGLLSRVAKYIDPQLNAQFRVEFLFWMSSSLLLCLVFALIYAISGTSLRCEECNRQYNRRKRSEVESKVSRLGRSKFMRFFWPDELIDKQLKCPYCITSEMVTRGDA